MSSHPLPIQEPPQEYSHLKSIPLLLPKGLTFDFSTGSVSGSAEQGLYLVEEVIRSLDKLVGSQGPLSIVNIVGPARTGKSYVASRLLGSANAFELGHTMNAQTMGVWLATRTLKGNNATILVLDTEGLDAHSGDQRRDDGLFLFSVLLSSFLIYNSTGVHRSTDLERMEYIVNLADRVETGSNTKQGQDFRLHFPHFLWLLRDHFLKPTIDDKEVTPTEYLLHKVLKQGLEDDEEIKYTQRAILTFFRSIKCFALPAPTENIEILKNMDKATPQVLNLSFSEGVQELLYQVLREADCPKKLSNGSVVTTIAFIELMRNLLVAVNDPNVVINIPRLTETVQKEIWRVFEVDAINSFVQIVKSFAFPVEESELVAAASRYCREDLLREASDKVLSLDDQQFKILYEQLREKLIKYKSDADHSIIGGEILWYLTENRKKSEEHCRRRFKELWTPIERKLHNHNNYSMEDFKMDLTSLQSEYNSQGRGPAKLRIEAENLEFLKQQQSFFSNLKGYQKQLFDEEYKTEQERLRIEEIQQQNFELLKQYHERQKSHDQELVELEKRFKKQSEDVQKENKERIAKEEERLQQFMKTRFEEDVRNSQETMRIIQESQKLLTAHMEASHAQALAALKEIANKPQIVVVHHHKSSCSIS